MNDNPCVYIAEPLTMDTVRLTQMDALWGMNQRAFAPSDYHKWGGLPANWIKDHKIPNIPASGLRELTVEQYDEWRNFRLTIDMKAREQAERIDKLRQEAEAAGFHIVKNHGPASALVHAPVKPSPEMQRLADVPSYPTRSPEDMEDARFAEIAAEHGLEVHRL